MNEKDRFARRLCLAVDVWKYSPRGSVGHDETQSAMIAVLDRAASAVRLDRDAWERQVQGDSELSLIPADQSEPRVVDDFFRELDDALRRHNHGRHDVARLRLRAAVHFGVAFESAAGFAGDAPILTARMLNSAQLRQALQGRTDADLVVALSDLVYQDNIVNRHCSLEPDDFARCEVVEEAKDFRATAWVRVLRRHPRAAESVASAAASAHLPAAADQASGGAEREAGWLEAARHAAVSSFHGPVRAGVIGINLGAVEISDD